MNECYNEALMRNVRSIKTLTVFMMLKIVSSFEFYIYNIYIASSYIIIITDIMNIIV